MSFKERLHQLEDWHNRAADTRFVWFPFVFLRPAKDQTMGAFRIVLMSICFGLYFVVFLILRKVVFRQHFDFDSVLMSTYYSIGGFVLWFSFVTAPLWNRRARQLRIASQSCTQMCTE